MNPYSHIRGIDFSLKFLTSKTNAKDTFLELLTGLLGSYGFFKRGDDGRTGKNIIKGMTRDEEQGDRRISS